jgi:hypothetical protein
MRKRITLLVTAAILVLTMALAVFPATAAPPCPAGSDTERAESTGEPGEFSCTTTVTSTKNEKFTRETETTTKGSSGPHEDTDTACEPTGSGKCPPGQF